MKRLIVVMFKVELFLMIDRLSLRRDSYLSSNIVLPFLPNVSTVSEKFPGGLRCSFKLGFLLS